MAVIFDMDGVLIDSEKHWRTVEGQFLASFIPGWSDDDQQRILGMSIYDVHKLLKAEYNFTLTPKDFLTNYKEKANELYGKLAQPLPGALETLSALLEADISCAVCSSSPGAWISIVVDRFGLRQKLAAVVSSDDVEGVGKPSPRIYQFCRDAICSAEFSTAEPIFAIEDTDKGIASAKGAGLRPLGLRNGMNEKQQFSEAERVFEGFSDELLDFLLREHGRTAQPVAKSN